MNHRAFSAVCAVFLGSTFYASMAEAAESVFGPGPAWSCFEAADRGLSAQDYMIYCNQALNGALSENDRASTYVNRGVLELSLSEVNAAQDDFNAALALNTNLADAYVDRGATLIAQKKYADAIKDISQGIAIGSKKPQLAYYDRAIANESLGDVKAAYDDYRQALMIAPDFTLAADELKRFKVVQKPSGS